MDYKVRRNEVLQEIERLEISLKRTRKTTSKRKLEAQLNECKEALSVINAAEKHIKIEKLTSHSESTNLSK